MTKKYVLAGAIAAFLAVANVAYAPTASRQLFAFQNSKIAISTGSFLERYAKESEEKIQALLKKLDDLDNYRTDSFNEDSDELLLARMIFGETEDCSKTEKIAVAFTALNRLKKGTWYGKSLKEVILKPYQYSCFNPELNSSIFLKDPLKHNEKEFLISLQLAKEILNGKYKDPTRGATHYYNPKKVREPPWTKKFTGIRGIRNSYHVFYKEK